MIILANFAQKIHLKSAQFQKMDVALPQFYSFVLPLLRVLKESSFKDTHRENTLPNKTQVLTKSMNINIWVIGTLSQLFKRASHAQFKFSKKK